MDNIFSSNISQREKEGLADNRQWKDFKLFALWFIIVTIIIGLIVKIIDDMSNEYIELSIILYGILSIVFTSKIFNEVDKAVNTYINRKLEFYYTAYSKITDKYSCADNQIQMLQYFIEKFHSDNKLKSAYIVPIGMYVPIIIFIFWVFLVMGVGFGYKPNDFEGDMLVLSPLIMIIIFIVCFAFPLKKRISIWHSINKDEKHILDEISKILINNEETKMPVSIEIEKKFKNSYFIIFIASVISIVGYVIIDTTLASQEKLYLKMVYPVEDKLSEILGY